MKKVAKSKKASARLKPKKGRVKTTRKQYEKKTTARWNAGRKGI